MGSQGKNGFKTTYLKVGDGEKGKHENMRSKIFLLT